MKRSSPFLLEIESAIRSISASPHTRSAYLTDAKHWLAFCEEDGTDPTLVPESSKKTVLLQLDAAVGRWLDEMREAEAAPKTRVRRMSALSSIYDCLRRRDKGAYNPFSPTEIKREKANRLEPTPIVSANVAARMFAGCEGTPNGVRDLALLRLLWATGLRRGSIGTLTRGRIEADGDSYVAEVDGKGGKLVRVLVQGKAAEALRALLAEVPTGHVFLHRKRDKALRPMVGRDVWEVIHMRAKAVGAEGISPHSFRAAFITFGEAPLDARQDAAGHSDSATTRLYDRQWRGRKAFEMMPEAEDLVKEKMP